MKLSKQESSIVNLYRNMAYIFLESKGSSQMPEDEAKKKGLKYNDPRKHTTQHRGFPGSQSDATVGDKPVVVRHGWKSSKRKPKKKSQESHATVRIRSAGEGDHLKRRADRANRQMGSRESRQAELKASMQSRRDREDRKALSQAAAGHKDAPSWAKKLSRRN